MQRLLVGKRSKIFTPIKNNKGFSFLEVLISLVIITIGLLSLFKLHLFSLRYSNSIYFQDIAKTRIEAMTEQLRVNHYCVNCEVVRWNDINKRLLPQAQGIVSGSNPYHIVLTWLESTGRLNRLSRDVIL